MSGGNRHPREGGVRFAAGDPAAHRGATLDATSTSARAVLSLPFDDLEQGGTFTTPGRTITEADVGNFAALTGDRHPQHVDDAWAAGSQFGERIAHGLLVLSCAVGLIPLDPERIIALRRVSDAVFKRPVRLGDTISVDGRIERTQPIGELTGLVVCGLTIVNQAGQTVARVAIDLIWQRET
jgi:3-hydroxybutyryl-CoA dehydratase